eukprot:1151737-Pelagomonas_calceolata.AAC.2
MEVTGQPVLGPSPFNALSTLKKYDAVTSMHFKRITPGTPHDGDPPLTRISEGFLPTAKKGTFHRFWSSRRV